MPPPDYRDWLTKAEAATAIGVSTKTIEAWAQAKKLQQAFRPQAHGPALAVFHPEDVARLASERRTVPAAFVVPAGTDVGRGNGRSLAVPAHATGGAELFREFLGAAVQAIAAATPVPTSEKTSESSQKWVLTLAEAAAASGWSRTYLRRAIAEGRLPAERDGGWKIRRDDLQQLRCRAGLP